MIKRLFSLEEQPLPALANSSYNWFIPRVVTGDTVQIESNDLPSELSSKLKVLKIKVNVTNSEAAVTLLETTITNTSTVMVELDQWNASTGALSGDAIVDGIRLSTLLIDNNLATPLS